eukprot:XP_019077647.1 PREDICTED: putative disease resistance protein RGA3 [Vitis vinifera]
METVGREYFENLAARSFFQDFEKDVEGNIVRCKMHGIVHDFAQFLTNNECLIVEDDCENLKTNLSLQKGRHATVILDGSCLRMCRGLPKGVGRLTSLRTLSCFIVGDENGSDVCKIEEMRNLKELRELEITGLGKVEDAGEAEKAELKNKKQLYGLSLDFQPCRQPVVVKEVAEALQPHPNLKSLRIRCACLLWGISHFSRDWK